MQSLFWKELKIHKVFVVLSFVDSLAPHTAGVNAAPSTHGHFYICRCCFSWQQGKGNKEWSSEI